MPQKSLPIETLRGLAILLVVLGHVIGSTQEGGMKIDFPSPFRYLYLWIDYIQMPLFTAIAGWVYALKPVSADAIGRFVQKKVFRLLVPMAMAGTLYFLVQYIVPGTNQKGNLIDIWRIYFFPYTIYWYLPSLFIMFIMAGVMDAQKWANQLKGWLVCCCCTYILLLAEKNIIPDSLPNLFSFKGAIGQFPYFIIGLGINRFSKELFTPFLKKAYIFLALTGIILLQVEWFYPLYSNALYECVQPLWVIALLFVLLSMKYENRFFARLGCYAYIIYLYHGFGTSGGRIISNRLGIHTELLVFIFAGITALAFPIILDRVIRRWKVSRFLFLGEK